MTPTVTTFFEIGDNGQLIRIDLVALSYPNAELVWDRNWIKSIVTVKAGVFDGQLHLDLMKNDFERFKEQLSTVYHNLDGAEIFDTMEGQVSINIKGDGIGHYVANGSAMDYAGTVINLTSRSTLIKQ